MTLRRAGGWLMLLATLAALPAVAQQPAASARQMLVEAGRALAQGQPEQALKAYEAALGLAAGDDERAQALFGLANVHRSRRDGRRQLDCLRQAEALPQAGAAYVQAARQQLAVLYREQRDFAAARQMSEKLLAAAHDPNERLALALDLAQLDLRQGQPADAVKRLQPLLAQAGDCPALPEIYTTLIMGLIGANRAPEAVALVREALRQFPARTDILLGTAQELADRGKPDQATALLQEALLAKPEQEDVLRALYDICSSPEQLKRLGDWLDKQARGAGAEIWLGHLAKVHAWAGHLPPALEAYARLLALTPQDAAAAQAAARLALQANDYARAEAWLRQALAARPGDESLATLLGEALLRQGKLQPALAAWQQGLGFAADDPQSVRRLGGVLMRYELYEAALDAYREGRRAAGQRDAFALYLGNAYEKLGQSAEAAREYVVALTSRDRLQTALSAVNQLYHLADDEAACPHVAAALQAAREQGELPTEGLGVLLYARALQGDDTRELLAAVLPAQGGGEARRELTSAALRAAGRLEARGQPELALPLYERLMQGAPGEAMGRQLAERVADLQLQTGDWRAALATLKQALESGHGEKLLPPQRAELALKLGDVLLRQGRRPTDAIGAYEIVVAAAPDTMTARQAQWGQADALFTLGDYDQALGEYARLLKLPATAEAGGGYGVPGLPGRVTLPQEDYVACQRAEALLRQGQYEKAGLAFHKLAADDAGSAYANDALQRVLLVNRLEQDKAGAEAYVRAVRAWARGEAEAALKALDGVYGGPAGSRPLLRPAADAGLMLLAEIRVWQGDIVGAVAAYDRLLAECPASFMAPRAAFTAAMVQSKQDRPAARQRLQALVQRFPDTTEAEEATLVLQAWEQATRRAAAEAP